MPYETIPIEAEKATTVHVLVGTISDLDEEAGTVEVDIDGYGSFPGVPVFYHCQNEETADGMPFAEADRVLIVNSGDAVTLSVSDMKIVGFEDGLLRPCGFQFKLTRGDGTLITEENGLLGYVGLSDSDNHGVSITTPTYNANNECWSFNLADSADADKDGYWVDYVCEEGLFTQYPHRYKDADKDKIADLVKAGAYEDIIPYWKIESSYVDIVSGSTITCPETPYDPAHRSSQHFVMAPSLSWGKRYSVKSSVPYQISRRASNQDIVGDNNITDHFFFAAAVTGGGICCNSGAGCINSGNTTTGDIRTALITGGALSVVVTKNNAFDETDDEIVEGSPSGKNHDITFTNTTALSITTSCVATPPACQIDGDITGVLRSLSGELRMISISVAYDY